MCEVLLAGEEGGSNASTVFAGMGLGAAFKFIVDGLKIVPSDIATPNIKGYAGQIGVEIYPALIGVGYICGPSISSYMFAGGIIAWLVLIPAVVFFVEASILPHLVTPVWQVRLSQKFTKQTEQVLSGLTLSNTWVPVQSLPVV